MTITRRISQSHQPCVDRGTKPFKSGGGHRISIEGQRLRRVLLGTNAVRFNAVSIRHGPTEPTW